MSSSSKCLLDCGLWQSQINAKYTLTGTNQLDFLLSKLGSKPSSTIAIENLIRSNVAKIFILTDAMQVCLVYFYGKGKQNRS